MVSVSSWAALALSATTVFAYPKAQWQNYGHQRWHKSGGLVGSGYANPTDRHRHHHNGTETTQYVTVTVYDTSSTSIAAATVTPVVQNKEACAAPESTQTITSTSTVYVTVTVPQTSSTTTTTEAAPTTTSAQPTSLTVDPVYTSEAAYPTATAAGQFYRGQESSTTATASTAAAAAAANTYTKAKKGLSFESASNLAPFSDAGASWAYNWGISPAQGAVIPSGLEYVPMCWGSGTASSCQSSVQAAVKNYGASHVLSFNEPDLPAQANLDPQTAYNLHKANVAPLKGTVQIGSPAVTNSGSANQGLDWMKQFLDLCYANNQDTCNIDFLALHWYADVSAIDYFKSHIKEAIALGQKYGINKVWVTEFAATGGSASDEAAFLTKAVTWLESSDASAVERYAYFLAGNAAGLGMMTNNALNAIGQAYNVIV